MTEAEKERAAVVAWLIEQAEQWHAKTQEYRKAGNLGPYLGEPSGWLFATAISRGDHLKGTVNE